MLEQKPEIIENSERVTINRDNEVIYVDKVPIGLKAAIILYDIEQPTKKLHNSAFIKILTALNLNKNLVKNRNAKHAVQSASFNAQEKREPGPSRTRSTLPTWQEKSSANLKRSIKHKRKSLSGNRKTRNQKFFITIQILQRLKRRRRKQNNGKITKIEEKLLKTKYSDKGPVLFGSVNNLIKATNLSRKKVKHFLHTEPAYTKYRTVIRKTPRLKVIVYNIDEIWSLDLAFVDKLAQYNHDVKYLLVAVDCMSRYLRVQPLKPKYATTTAEAFKLMITTKQPKKV